MYAPWTGRTIGVEMEVNKTTTTGGALTETMLRTALERAIPGRISTRVASYYHSTGQTWDVKTDGSCGWEVATRALTLNDQGHNAELAAGCDGVGSIHPRCGSDTGLHVHVGVPDYSWEDMQRLLRLWVRYEPLFYQMLPTSRHTGIYSVPSRSAKWSMPGASAHWRHVVKTCEATTEYDFFRSLRRIDRRMGLNTTIFETKKRVEFRLHSGTVSYAKIRPWSMLLVALVNRAKAHQPGVRIGSVPQWSHPTFDGTFSQRRIDPKHVGKVLGLLPSTTMPDVAPEGKEVVDWMTMRLERFADDHYEQPRPMPPRRTGWDVATPGSDRTVVAGSLQGRRIDFTVINDIGANPLPVDEPFHANWTPTADLTNAVTEIRGGLPMPASARSRYDGTSARRRLATARARSISRTEREAGRAELDAIDAALAQR